MEAKSLLVLLIMLSWPLLSLGAQPAAEAETIPVQFTVRVDTTNADVGAVFRLWRDYLRSRPDSVRANPFWSEAEQRQYVDFDLSRKWVYPEPHLLRYFVPRVLSIEPRGDKFEIRTLYLAEGPAGTGGPGEPSPSEAFRALASVLERSPDLDLPGLLVNRFFGGSTDAYYAAGAGLVRMAEEEGGPDAVKRLLAESSGGTDEDLYRAAAAVLGLEGDQLSEEWRRRVAEYGSTSGTSAD